MRTAPRLRHLWNKKITFVYFNELQIHLERIKLIFLGLISAPPVVQLDLC